MGVHSLDAGVLGDGIVVAVYVALKGYSEGDIPEV
jgi:hypothetical protein